MAKKSNRKKQTARQRKQQQQMTRIASILGVLAILILGGILISRGMATSATSDLGELSAIPALGNADARIEIVEYGDFSCHACRELHNSGFKEAVQLHYGDDISFTFKHFAWGAPTAAEASQCAADQGLFWEYHDYIYGTAPEGALQTQDLKSYAADIGLETEQFNECLDGGKYTRFVQQETSQARSLGLRGTPSILVNGRQINPNQIFEVIDAILEG